MTRRGKILRDTNSGPGLLTVDGKQYVFTLENMWASDVPPRTGMTVGVNFTSEGAPQSVHAIPESQLTKEQAEQALADARRHGGAIATSVRARFGVPTLVAEVLLLISFFILPSLSVGNAFARRALTGWEVTGLNVSTQLPNDHGFLSLVAVLCLLAPFGVPFWQSIWSRWLYAAPLAFSILAYLTIYIEIQNAGHGAVQGMGQFLGVEAARQMSQQISEMFSVSIGAYLVLICSAYLASRSLKLQTFSRDFLKSAVSLLLVCSIFLSTSIDLRAQSTPQPTPSSGGGMFGTLSSLPKSPGQLEQYALERAMTKALGESLPVKLDANNTYPTVNTSALPGGPFNGKPLAPTVENLTKVLPAGDWVIPALAFCQEYSVHRPGAGTAYKIGPLEGSKAELIGTFLWRGIAAGKAPNELQAVEWAIEAGVTYDRMPKPYQNDIDQLIPSYKGQLEGDWLQRTRTAYTTAAADPAKAIKALGMIPGMGMLGGLFLKRLPTPPPYEQFLQKLGPAGRFALEGEQLQTKFQASATSEEMREQVLFEGQGTQLPPVSAQEGPWTVKTNGVYMRFKVQGGNLQANNTLEIRVLPHQKTARSERKPYLAYASYKPEMQTTAITAQQVTLLSLMGITLAAPKLATAGGAATEAIEAAELVGVIASGAEIAFAVGVGAQALIIVFPLVAKQLHDLTNSKSTAQTKASTSCTEEMPVVTFYLNQTPEIATHINEAQAGNPGWKVLTLSRSDLTVVKSRRSKACPPSFTRNPGTWCDEYPFATALEGGAGASAKAVPIKEQQDQATILRNFYSGKTDGTQFCVDVQ